MFSIEVLKKRYKAILDFLGIALRIKNMRHLYCIICEEVL